MKRHYLEQNNRRIFILCAFSLLIFLFLACGLFYRQIIQHQYFRQKEYHQNLRRVVIPAPRGNICDRNGKILVCNRPSFELHLYFNDIRSGIREEYTKLIRQARMQSFPINYSQLQQQARFNVVQNHLDLANNITGRRETLDAKVLERHYRESLLLPITILSNLSQIECTQLIDRLPLKSPLDVATNYHRFYPYHSAACHVLGYVTASNENITFPNSLKTFQFTGKTGKAGIELSCNTSLSGSNGEKIFSVDSSGFRAKCVEETPPRKGQDCILSIDIELQMVAEQALGNRLGSIIVLDVQSGEVLAMVSKPDFDLNLLSPRISTENFQKITEEGAWLNRAIQVAYPPGSTFKIISTIAFLRHKIVSWESDDIIDCPGHVSIGGRDFKCDHSTAHGSVSLSKALEKSCNVYYYLQSQSCGIEKLAEEAKRFHLDQKTEIELPFETHRMIIPTSAWKQEKGYGKWFPGDTANTSIGQGFLLVSPLQMACLVASLSQNRTQTIPHILHDKAHTQLHHPTIELSSYDYKSLIQALQAEVDIGTGRQAKLHHTSLAGKTGTSQVWEYGEKRNVAWFVGFAPVENPSIAIAISIQGSKYDDFYGGNTAAPIARRVLDFYFKKKQ